MSERYERIFSLGENLYQEGSPIIVSAGVLLKDSVTGNIIAQMKFKNITEDIIKAVKIDLNTYDISGVELQPALNQQYLDFKVRRDEEFGQKKPIVVPDKNTRAFSIKRIDIVFENGNDTVLDITDLKPICSQKYLKDVLGDNLAEQYRKETTKLSKYVLEQDRDIWLCTCGAVNKQIEIECHSCKLSKDMVISMMNEDMLEDHFQESERKRQIEERENQEEAKKKRRKISGRIAVVCGILLVISGIYFLVTKLIMPSVRYNKAVELEKKGNYEEAYAIYESIGREDAVVESKMNRAEDLIKNEDFETAYSLLDSMGRKDLIDKNKKERIDVVLKTGNNEEAYRLINALFQTDTDNKKEAYKKVLSGAQVGSYVYLGSYEQDNDLSNGAEDIEWLVLDREGNKCLLISRYILDCKPFYVSEDSSITRQIYWKDSSIRIWLNNGFIKNSFDQSEYEMITDTEIQDDSGYNTTTKDKVFILSISEAEELFDTDSSRICQGTSYALIQGLKKGSGGNSPWFLRTTRLSSDFYVDCHAAFVSEGGTIRTTGTHVVLDKYTGTRPCIWIDSKG